MEEHFLKVIQPPLEGKRKNSTGKISNIKIIKYLSAFRDISPDMNKQIGPYKQAITF